jgi:hypothetical protein
MFVIYSCVEVMRWRRGHRISRISLVTLYIGWSALWVYVLGFQDFAPSV